jgi:hypothetical protein
MYLRTSLNGAFTIPLAHLSFQTLKVAFFLFNSQRITFISNNESYGCYFSLLISGQQNDSISEGLRAVKL